MQVQDGDVYRESQSEAAPSPPVGSFVVVTFESDFDCQLLHDFKLSFAAGTKLLPNFGAKIERESKLRLDDFVKELSFGFEGDLDGGAIRPKG
ncbi:hypothetical protein L2E82_29475 [Cichorium intybus]|uniref:Uncharacterized protein n=1 Tax=Cichorium intybus TaxID=13427 RepID=A0ACB9CXR0_CICIN|nr:hypothetical protein L2E82_29475 [Cichorium intybus]